MMHTAKFHKLQPIDGSSTLTASVTSSADVPAFTWSFRHGLFFCLVVSGVVRLLCLGSIPLIITNDGVGYLTWAQQLFQGQTLTILPYRTPGYPLFLAGVFHVFGIGPNGVLVTQHLMGWLGTGLVFFIACRLSNPIAATVAGVLYSMDPWILGISCFALSEPLASLTILAAAALTFTQRPGRMIGALLLGGLLGFCCLIRPTCQILIPFFLVARALRTWPLGWHRACVVLFAGVVGAAVTLLPWLHFNAQRGIHGLSTGSGTFLWMNVKQFGLLDTNYPVDADVRQAYERHLAEPTWNEDKVFRFLFEIDAFDKRSRPLGDWAKASLRARPFDYLARFPVNLCWLLRFYPAFLGMPFDDLQDFVHRATENRDNIQYSGNPENMELFRARSKGGMMRRFLHWHVKHVLSGIPGIPLFVFSLAAIMMALSTRDWATISIYVGSIALLFAHVALLCVASRYTLPVWPVWYAATAPIIARIVLAARNAYGRRRAGRQHDFAVEQD